MREISLDITSESVPHEEIWRAMGYGDAVPEDGIREMTAYVAERLAPVSRLRFMYEIVEAEKLSPGEVSLGGVRFGCGPIIGSYLKGMTRACVFVATAGREFAKASESLKAEGDIVLDFVADSLGSVLAEYAVSALGKHLSEEVIPSADLQNMKLSLPYSPGYCGWNISEQKSFFTLFPEDPCGVRLTDSFLMQPEKSVSGFYALGADLVPQPYRCDVCANPNCFKRKK